MDVSWYKDLDSEELKQQFYVLRSTGEYVAERKIPNSGTGFWCDCHDKREYSAPILQILYRCSLQLKQTLRFAYLVALICAEYFKV